MGASKNNSPLINGSCRWKIHRGERYEATKKKKTKKKPSTRRISCSRDIRPNLSFFFLFIFFPPPPLPLLARSPRRIVSRGSKRGEGVEIAEAHSRGPGGNERFTSEIRMARRKSICGASTPIVLPIPRATFSARNENCKLPVYDISQRVRRAFVCGERKRTGAKKRIEIITPGANRNFVLSVLTQSIRRYPITEKNTRVSKRGREFSR